MILCTSKDKDFENYKERISIRKVFFTIKLC